MNRRTIQIWLSYMPLALVLAGIFYVHFHKTVKTVTAEATSVPTILYFPGTVNPLEYYSILSPNNGTITSVLVHYGQLVDKGELIYIMNSSDFADAYRQSLESLLKSASSFQNLQFQHNGNTELYKLGLISRIAFMDSQQQLASSALDLDESKIKIVKLLNDSGQKNIDVTQLSLNNMDKVHQVLQKPLDEVKIYAEHDGLLFFPSRTFGGGDDTASKLARGTIVRQGQTIAIIGNLSGMLLDVTVTETDIHKLYIQQKAKITGPAFEGIVLDGFIYNISRQASSAQYDSTPAYTVTVKVPALDKKQRKVIQVGMSVEVSFTIPNPATIKIPLAAVYETNNGYAVKVMGKNEQIKEVAVKTGITKEDTVEILKGLSEGDKIVIPN